MHKQGRVTLEDVAKRAGVSRATASRVIRGDVVVTGKKIRAVQDAVRELGYVPSTAARALAQSRSGMVAMIIPEPDATVFSDPFFADVVQTATRELARWDTQLLITFDDAHGAHSGRTAAFLGSGVLDGAMVVSHHQFRGQVEAYAAAPLPVVFVGRPVGLDPDTLWVDADNEGGGRRIAQLFVERGVRRPAVVTGPMDMVASQDRLRGFSAVMDEPGREVLTYHAAFTAESGAAAGAALLPRIQAGEVDGVFFFNDLMASAAMDLWEAAGVSAPRDVLVAGYDNNEIAVRRNLTSVTNSASQLAAAATEVLMAHVQGAAPEPQAGQQEPRLDDTLILPAPLIERASTVREAPASP